MSFPHAGQYLLISITVSIFILSSKIKLSNCNLPVHVPIKKSTTFYVAGSTCENIDCQNIHYILDQFTIFGTFSLIRFPKKSKEKLVWKYDFQLVSVVSRKIYIWTLLMIFDIECIYFLQWQGAIFLTLFSPLTQKNAHGPIHRPIFIVCIRKKMYSGWKGAPINTFVLPKMWK